MSQSLLIEFLSEEMPSNEQVSGAEQLAKNIKDALQANRIACGEHTCFSTPRRIAVLFADVAEQSEAIDEEIKGPKKSAPQQAIDGFLKKYDLSEKDCTIKIHKGEDTYFYIDKKQAQKTDKLLEAITCKALNDQSWKNSMRFANEESTWIRPLRNILVMLGDKVISGKLDLGSDTLKFADSTIGHSRLHPKPVKLTTADEYEKILEQKSVIANAEKRQQMILDELGKLKLKWQEDERLLKEVTGLVEYPYFAIGSIDKDFLKLPAEVLATAMITHQKYFPLFDGKKPADKFAFVANLPVNDDIIKGNERVLRSRLGDASFLFAEDIKIPLADRIDDLKNINYFDGLGTMYDKTERLKKLAEYVAEHFDIREEKAIETASLLKADLTTEMVGEFPELQGIMGGEYAKRDYGSDIVQAIRNHYRIDDNENLSQAMSLIDMVDHLVGFWLIDKKPTGSKDPFALRQTALGVMRTMSQGALSGEFGKKSPNIHLYDLFSFSCETYEREASQEIIESLMKFFYERLKIVLRNLDFNYDMLDAIFNKPNYSEYVIETIFRLEILKIFLETPEVSDTITAYKRIMNILKSEGALDVVESFKIEESLLKETAEKELWQAYKKTLSKKIKFSGDFYQKLASLVKPINNFFDNVMVNDPDKKIRQNRLNLLKAIYTKAEIACDFSKLVDR